MSRFRRREGLPVVSKFQSSIVIEFTSWYIQYGKCTHSMVRIARTTDIEILLNYCASGYQVYLYILYINAVVLVRTVIKVHPTDKASTSANPNQIKWICTRLRKIALESYYTSVPRCQSDADGFEIIQPFPSPLPRRRDGFMLYSFSHSLFHLFLLWTKITNS